MRGTPAELEALVGQTLLGVRRRGKLLLLDLERDRIVVNPMLTGRLQLASPGTPLPSKTAVVLALGPRAKRPRGSAKWTARAGWIPADEASAEVRYRDPTQMGKVYLVPAGVQRVVPGLTDEDSDPTRMIRRSRSMPGRRGSSATRASSRTS